MNSYLDDCREAPEGWKLVKTAHECIQLLKTIQIEKLSLDHDLGDGCTICWKEPTDVNEVLLKACADDCKCPCHATGMVVVKFMIENNIWPNTKPNVHSMNPIGATNMRKLIDRYWQAL